MLSAKRGTERCILRVQGLDSSIIRYGIQDIYIRLQRSTPSVEVSVRTRNPRSDYPFTQFGSTILIVDNCSRQNRSAVKFHGGCLLEMLALYLCLAATGGVHGKQQLNLYVETV